ncbi:MAG TPA: fasciclin domain-containing protein, partial [Phycisphaerae bacterium]|nr:fasciclin domain-containing protein [Phycisphaerae bacterium]
AELEVAMKDGKCMLNGKAAVTKADMAASNGVVHLIDTVLTPPEKKAEPKMEVKPAEKKPEAKPAEKKPEEKKPAEKKG